MTMSMFTESKLSQAEQEKEQEKEYKDGGSG